VPATYADAGSTDVIITEFQTNGGSAAQEFIELYNTTDEDIALDGAASQSSGYDADADEDISKSTTPQQWKLQFFNSSSVKGGMPMWSTTPSASNSISLVGVIPAHEYFLIASTGYQPGGITADMEYSASSSHLMTDTGGALQLISTEEDSNTTYAHDQVMWLAQSGGATLPEGVLASPSSGKSLQRIPNDDTEYVDEDGTLAPFGMSDFISPLDAWVAPAIIDTSVDTDESGDEATDVTTVVNDGLQAPQITELLPNPGSPLTDADDEFIELYNPNESSFDLSGYKLEVGTTTLHTFTFDDATVMAPLSYLAFYSSETGLSLSNSGSQVRLRDRSGVLIDETKAYDKADDNQSWIRDDGNWQWTTTPTPGQPNVLAAPAVAIKSAAKKAAKKTTKAKTAKAKTTKAAKKKKSAAKAAASVAPIEKPKPPIHVGILVGVAAAAVLYGLYEYRHDIILAFQKLRRDRRTGSQNRLAAPGR
jgi:hypothetical protein